MFKIKYFMNECLMTPQHILHWLLGGSKVFYTLNKIQQMPFDNDDEHLLVNCITIKTVSRCDISFTKCV